MKISSGICKLPLMLKLGVPVGLAVDGCGSNDASNLLADLRTAFLLHRLNSSKEAPTGYEFLKIATAGGAEILGRPDIGRLEAGKAADLFLIDVDRSGFVGALLDPAAFLATVGYGREVSLTMINGKIVWKDGRLQGIDEEKLRDEAKKQVEQVYMNLPTE
jgi:cytosine/adenosine deaminase-related metal-dependent hydrolase